MNNQEKNNYQVLSEGGKKLYKVGAVSLKGKDPRVRWLHPIGFIFLIAMAVIIPFHCMFSEEKVQEQYPVLYREHSTLWNPKS